MTKNAPAGKSSFFTVKRLTGLVFVCYGMLLLYLVVTTAQQQHGSTNQLSTPSWVAKSPPVASQGPFLRLYGAVDLHSNSIDSLTCLSTNRLVVERYVETYRLNHDYKIVELNMLTD